MAQKAPLDEIHNNCLNQILQAIENNPKGPKDHFIMMNLDMHKTGILGGVTPNLTKEQMQRCLGVTDLISYGPGIIKEMKKDKTNVGQLLDLVVRLKDDFRTELEEKDPSIYKEMEVALD